MLCEPFLGSRTGDPREGVSKINFNRYVASAAQIGKREIKLYCPFNHIMWAQIDIREIKLYCPFNHITWAVGLLALCNLRGECKEEFYKLS